MRFSDGKPAEYCNSRAIPRFDLSAMGAEVGDTVFADTGSLYEAPIGGITKCTPDLSGIHFEWNVPAIKVTEPHGEAVHLFNDAPTLVPVDVRNGKERAGGQITVKTVPPAKATS